MLAERRVILTDFIIVNSFWLLWVSYPRTVRQLNYKPFFVVLFIIYVMRHCDQFNYIIGPLDKDLTDVTRLLNSDSMFITTVCLIFVLLADRKIFMHLQIENTVQQRIAKGLTGLVAVYHIVYSFEFKGAL
jgi:hypothetical protein